MSELELRSVVAGRAPRGRIRVGTLLAGLFALYLLAACRARIRRNRRPATDRPESGLLPAPRRRTGSAPTNRAVTSTVGS